MSGNLFALILLTASAFGFFGFVKGHYENVQTLGLEKAEYEKALAEASEVDKVRSALVLKYTSIPKDNIERLEKLLPDSVDSIRLVLDISDMAGKSGMKVDDISVSSNAGTGSGTSKKSGSIVSVKVNNQAEPYDLSVAVSGSYEDFKVFLKDLENSLRVLDVTNISFQRAGDSELSKYSIKIKTYWLKK